MGVDLIQPSREHFRSLYEAHYDRIYSYCRRRVEVESVDDAVADVFLAVWRKIEDVPEPPDVIPWLYRVAYLTLSNVWRGLRRHRALKERLEGMRVSAESPPDELLAINVDVSNALAAAGRLNPTDQEILKLSLWEELSADDISLVMGIERNAVYQRLHRAKANLVREYEKVTTSRGFGRRPALRRVDHES